MAADLLTQGQICTRLGISDETWRRWRARGITPPRVELPGRPRWHVEHIVEFVSGRRWRNSEPLFGRRLSHVSTVAIASDTAKGASGVGTGGAR